MTDFARHYAEAPTELLIELQGERDTLSEEARQALDAELARRGEAIKTVKADLARTAEQQAMARPPLGLLLILLALSMFLGPIVNAISMIAQFGMTAAETPGIDRLPEWRMNQIISAIIWLLGAGLSLAGGLRLVRGRDPSVVPFLIIVVWLTRSGLDLVDILAGYLTWRSRGVSIGAAFSHSSGQLAADTLIAVLWTLYLLRSSRVQARYGGATAALAKAF